MGVLQAGTPDSFINSLKLKGIEFNWAISITYFMVTVLLIPSNLVMKRVSGKRYFPVIMVGFGTVVCCIAAVKGASGLLAARFFLGIPESGVVSALHVSHDTGADINPGTSVHHVLQLLVQTI